jgi:Ca-activated chloride channel family protein
LKDRLPRFRAAWLLFLLFLLPAAGCGRSSESGDSAGAGGGTASPAAGAAGTELRIISGSENKALQPLIERFARENNAQITMDYKGSVDIMLLLESGTLDYDAVWPANSLWTALGDKNRRVKDEQSIYWSPTVFGVKKNVAERLGWVGKPVKVDDILKAAEAGRLRFMMTSATQSNSGASAYLGYLYAFAGKPQVLTAADLQAPAVRAKIKRILGAVNRSSGSSGWLKDLFLQRYDDYDAMVNYESLLIEANRQLAQEGREPLYAVYPADGLAIADAPLGYVDQGDAGKQALFRKLQTYLLSEPVQAEILRLGRRVGPVGAEIKGADRDAGFNPDWGIQTAQLLNPIRYPKAEVIRQALDLYQSAFRKPSLTVYCLDYSRSMDGERIESLKSAMRRILDQDLARQSLLQASPRDITVVIPFAGRVLGQWEVRGNDPEKLRDLLARINATELANATDIYSPTIRAFEYLKSRPDLEDYFPAVILMTDGESNTGATAEDLRQARAAAAAGGAAADVPVFCIRFGEASGRQLEEIAETTSGRVFDAAGDLAAAFREARGYN